MAKTQETPKRPEDRADFFRTERSETYAAALAADPAAVRRYEDRLNGR